MGLVLALSVHQPHWSPGVSILLMLSLWLLSLLICFFQCLCTFDDGHVEETCNHWMYSCFYHQPEQHRSIWPFWSDLFAFKWKYSVFWRNTGLLAGNINVHCASIQIYNLPFLYVAPLKHFVGNHSFQISILVLVVNISRFLMKHFANAGFPCPIMQSPSDHFLRAINTDFDRIIAMCKNWQVTYSSLVFIYSSVYF